MTVDAELREFVASTFRRASQLRERDIKIVASYYGFGKEPRPTYDALAVEFGLGGREAIRQIIEKRFRKFLRDDSLGDLQVLSRCGDFIRAAKFVDCAELKRKIISAGLAPVNVSIPGLIRLLQDCSDQFKSYGIYTSSVGTATASEIERSGFLALIRSDYASALGKAVKKARTLPGMPGLARLGFLRRSLPPDVGFDAVYALLSADSECTIVKDDEDEYWYAFEDRENSILNMCAKRASESGSHDISVARLARVVENALGQRSYDDSVPGALAIERFLRVSPQVHILDNEIRYLGVPKGLTPIESDAVQHLRRVGDSSFGELRDYLESKGWPENTVKSLIFHSEFIEKDVSGGRKDYIYRLAWNSGNADLPMDDELSRQEEFSTAFRELYGDGTDYLTDAFQRREQNLLREWLFSGKETDRCGICGQLYGVKALVVAHKKKRSLCTEEERLGPNIVMPMCCFGCDYLYESDLIRVVDGVVVEGAPIENEQTHEAIIVRRVLGRGLDDRWLRGEPGYFLRSGLQ